MGAPITGTLEITPEGWVHIRLDTVLPNIRYGSTAGIYDAIQKLIKAHKSALPLYSKAFLVINECCDMDSRRVFDHDNKAWKAIPNALKGRLFEDDDQFTLTICLMATYAKEAACHIFVMPQADAFLYFLKVNFNEILAPS